jgi:hypothetical protein
MESPVPYAADLRPAERWSGEFDESAALAGLNLQTMTLGPSIHTVTRVLGKTNQLHGVYAKDKLISCSKQWYVSYANADGYNGTLHFSTWLIACNFQEYMESALKEVLLYQNL